MSEFLAEARILVRPDTTRFRAELQSELTAATRGVTVAIPVTAQAAVSTAAAQQAAQQVTGAAVTAASAVSSLTQSTRAATSATADLARIQTLTAQSATDLTRSELLVANATNAVAVAQIRAGVAVRDVLRAQEALGAALATGNPLLIRASALTSQLAVARQAQATATLTAARTEAAHATALGSVQTAGLASAASVLGLRGAVLTAGAAFLGATIGIQAFIRGVQATAALERELNTLRVVTGATAEQMEAVSAAAVRLGSDVRLPAVSASDAAVAMAELARAGLSVEDAMAGAEGVLQLATAAQLDNAQAAQIAANALNAFGLAGDQATRVADTFANAANAAQGSIADIGIAFRQASAVSRQVGLSLEDTTAILALFAKNGLQASDAGTALRTALIRLVAPGDAAAKKIRELGINIRDAQGNLRADVFAQFGEATRRLGPAARDAAAALIFGQDAIRAVSIGAREGTDGLRLMQFEIDQTGTAAEVAAARTEGFGGALEGLKSSIDTLAISLGGPINRSLGALVRGASEGVGFIQRFTDELSRLGDAAARPVSPEGGVGGFFQNLSADIRDAISPIQDFRDRFRGSIDVVDSSSLNAQQRLRALNNELQALQDARIAAERGGQRGVADQLTQAINRQREAIQALKEAGQGIAPSVTKPLEEAIDALERVRATRVMLDVDTTGIDRLIRSLKEQIPITQQTEGNINRLRDEIVGLGVDSRNSGGGVDALATAMANLQRQSSSLSDALLRLRTEGGSQQQQIGVLQQNIQVQRDIIAQAQAGGIEAGEPTIIRQAREEIIRLQGEIDSLRSEIASRQRKLVADAESAARELQSARDQADRAFLDVLSQRRDNTEFRAARARLTATLADDIRAQNAIQAQIRNQIRLIREQVQGEEARQAAIRELQNALRESQLLERQLRQQQRQAAEEAAQARQETRLRALELNLEFAEITGNENAQERALRAIITALEKRIAGMKGISNKERELRNELARRRKQLDELRGEQEENNRSAEQFFFEQLQAQQGFAANLLGNLITGPTAGLVGRPAATTGGTIQARISAEAAAAKGRQGGGPTSGQVNSTNELLLRILNQIKILTSTTEAPEAIEQRRTSGASLDYAVM